MSWIVPDYSGIVHLQKYRFHTPHARFSDPDIYVSVQRTRNLQNKVYPSPAPSPTSSSNISPHFPDYPCKPYPRRYSWKVMLEIYPEIHNANHHVYQQNIVLHPSERKKTTKEQRKIVTM